MIVSKNLGEYHSSMKCQSWLVAILGLGLVEANPDAKRLYDDLLSNYNRLIRPVVNHTQKVTVKLGLRLSQLVDLVSSTLFSSTDLLVVAQHSTKVHSSSIIRDTTVYYG